MATLNSEAVVRAFAQSIADAWAGEPVTPTAGEAPGQAAGLLITIPATGVASGSLVLWIERDQARETAARLLGAEAPDDAAVQAAMQQLASRAVTSLEGTPDAAGLSGGEATVAAGQAPAGAVPFAAALGEARVTFAVAVTLSAVSAAPTATFDADSRLDAILDVDLPLVVRFGRAMMPLRSVADLGPGSVVDMGRSPDEPVELLVGERLIARGEVVIVGGNYGVRITELTTGRRSTDMEARA